MHRSRWITKLIVRVAIVLFTSPTFHALVTPGLTTTRTLVSIQKARPTFYLSGSDLKTELEPLESFDPFQLSDDELRPTDVTDQLDLQQSKEKKEEIGIWAARGILLLVAAIWGTNFAVRKIHDIGLSCLLKEEQYRLTFPSFIVQYKKSVRYLENLCFHPPCHHPPSEAAFARFGIAALVSFPLLINQRKDVIFAGLECGMWITLGYVCQAVALSTISSGKCAFICSLTVVFVPLVSAVLYGRPMKLANIVAAAIAMSGVGILEGMIDFSALLGMQPAVADTGAAAGSVLSTSVEIAASAAGPIQAMANALGVDRGDIIALGQPIGFGYSFTRIEHYQAKFKDVPNRVLTIAAAQCVAVGLLSALWVLHDFNWVFPNFGYMMEPHRIVTILWTGIVTTVFAIFLEGIALQKATATDAAIAFSSEPVWASLFGFVLLHEQLGMSSYIGGTVILLACLVGALSDMPKAETPAEGVSD
jgi:drug/metabolite transporter (DMT)-like permease